MLSSPSTSNSQLCLLADIKNKTLTPMLQQYLQVKAAYKEYLLFYRMGDFYELFFDDAIKGAELLNITLTKRGMHGDKPIPMCGVPAHAYEQYLEKLIKSRHGIAICEQLETPAEAKKRGPKAVLRREVTRVITPGTIVEERLLNAKSANYLISIASIDKADAHFMALAWVDITTGEFCVSSTNMKSLNADLARLAPNEILLSEKLYQDPQCRKQLQEYAPKTSPRADNIFAYNRAAGAICQFFALHSLDGLGAFDMAEISAMGALLEYLTYTQKQQLPKLRLPQKLEHKNYMSIDSATRRNLELEVDSSGGREGSLLACLDHTCSNSGGRLLANYLALPLVDAAAINNRLDAVEYFYKDSTMRQEIRQHLRQTADIERILMRITAQRSTPRDLGALRDSLNIAHMIFATLHQAKNIGINLTLCQKQLTGFEALLEFLRHALVDELPLNIVEGNFVRPNFDANLDKLYKLQNNSQLEVAKLMDKYRTLTGISTLKITQNNVLGYFIEVTPSHAHKVQNEVFEHRQSLTTAVRYTTKELQQLEADIITCDDRILEQKLIIFAKIITEITKYHEALLLTSQSLAYVDVVAALAELAAQNGYARPVVDASTAFTIKQGRHPVVAKRLRGDFVLNDCTLEANQKIWILTGPNMAGKSTFLRQNALIAIMAQIGSFVPAQQAHIGVVDKLFSRIGAADDISRGQSTFMVEMLETAMILNNATAKSLVILDEVGRGTATYDGLAIANAVLEALCTTHCRTLFATHYHELTALEDNLADVACYTLEVRELGEEVIFMHKVQKGRADRSYGIHVAALAGLPKEVITRATAILAQLNNTPVANTNTQEKPQLALEPQILTEVKKLELDSITPRQAWDVLHKIKQQLC